jgi:hypothetical protein
VEGKPLLYEVAMRGSGASQRDTYLTMINGGRWHSACSDYDTHEADSVPRFGRRQTAKKSKRARGDLQRGPPR